MTKVTEIAIYLHAIFCRFSFPDFEYNLYEHRIHDVVTHETIRREESILEFVNITGAGVLHGEKAPAVQTIIRSPKISHLNINQSASHGINLVSPTDTMKMRFNRYKIVIFILNGFSNV